MRPRAEDGGPDADQRRPFCHRRVGVGGHAHRQLGQRQSRRRLEFVAEPSEGGEVLPRRRIVDRRHGHESHHAGGMKLAQRAHQLAARFASLLAR